LWKVVVSFVMSVCLSVCLTVCLSVRLEQLGYHWTDLNETGICVFLENTSRKCRIHENLIRMTDTPCGDLSTFMITSRWILLRITTVPAKLCRENTSRKCRIHENLIRMTDTPYGDLSTFMITSRWILLRITTVPAKLCTENQNTFCFQ